MSIPIIASYIVAIIVVGIVLNLGGWWLALRLLNKLRWKLRFEHYVAVRHLRGRKNGFLTLIGAFSILGVSVSSCNLTTVLSVMGGFSGDLKAKIFSTNSHVLVDQYGEDMDNWRPILDQLAKMEGVRAATPILHSDMMMNSSSNNAPMKLIGVEPDSFQRVSAALANLEQGDMAYLLAPHKLFEKVQKKRAARYGPTKTEPPPSSPSASDSASAPEEIKVKGGILVDPPPAVTPRQKVLPVVIVGREISRALRLYEGLEVNLINPVGGIGPTGPIPKSRPFRVGGVFFSGMFEFDNFFVYASLDTVQKNLEQTGLISEIQVAIDNPDKAQQIAQSMGKVLGTKYRVRSWGELNAPLFSALKLEKIVMFIVLLLATLVASFCIIATLTMLVLEKGAEISVMMTLGASPSDVKSIFRFEGVLIGVVGTLSGLMVGFGLCLFLENVGLPLDPEVWYIDKLPVNMEWLEFTLVGIASLIITQLATLYPAHLASKHTPVEGLKNE